MKKTSITEPAAPQGTASISRAIAVLREVGIYDRRGIRLVDLERNLEIERSTAHRVLQCLMYEGLVARKDPGNRYVLGPLAFELGLAAARRFKPAQVWQPALQAIADGTGEMVFLSIRSGLESVYLDKVEGRRATTADNFRVGDRRPLGFGCVGSAILSLEPPAQIQKILIRNSRSLKAYGATEFSEAFDRALEAKQKGYSIHAWRGLNVTTLAVPIVDLELETPGAVSIRASGTSVSEERIAFLVQTIKACIAQRRASRTV